MKMMKGKLQNWLGQPVEMSRQDALGIRKQPPSRNISPKKRQKEVKKKVNQFVQQNRSPLFRPSI